MESESEIVREIQQGKWSGFDRLYEFYLPKIYAFVYNRIRHKQTAEDITGAVFMKVIEHIHAFTDEKAGFKSWLYAIARNAVIDHYRKTKPVTGIEAVDVASWDSPDDDLDRQLLSGRIKQQLSALSAQQREVVLMRVWDDLSHREIGEVLGISEANSKVIFSRAIALLRQNALINTP